MVLATINARVVVMIAVVVVAAPMKDALDNSHGDSFHYSWCHEL